MATKTATKNKYGKETDKVILKALKEEDTIRGALRAAKEVLAKEKGIEATVNQLSSRYYSYIVPHYIEGEEHLELEENNKVHSYSSAGSFKEEKAEEDQETKLDLIKDLTDSLEWADRKELWLYLYQGL